jgi:hypothetical protein
VSRPFILDRLGSPKPERLPILLHRPCQSRFASEINVLTKMSVTAGRAKSAFDPAKNSRCRGGGKHLLTMPT